MQERSEFETVLVNGSFNFIGNAESSFRGPIKKGFRPIVWCKSINQATSCSFVSDVEIKEGQSKVVDIVILNELALGCEIKEGVVLNIGSTVHKIGEFIVIKDLGKWEEQVP